LKILTGESATESRLQVQGESLDERRSVSGSLLARLLELDDMLSDEPVGSGHDGIHRTGGGASGGIDDAGHLTEDGSVLTVKRV
jgi:hypothetical protein